MNVAALLQDSPSDDSHRRRQPPPPSTPGSGSQEHGERGAGGGAGSAGGGSGGNGGGGGGERGERGERNERGERGGSGGGGGSWGSFERDRTRVQSQNQSTWPPPYPSRPGQSSPSTPISTDTSPYAHPKDASWSQPVGNPYPPSAPQPPGSAPYDPASSTPSSRMRTSSNASVHGPPTTGPGVPPPAPPGSSYMPPPPPEYPHPPPHHIHKPQPPSATSTPLFPTAVPVAGQPRMQMSHSPPIGGSPYASGPPPASSSTPRRPQSQLQTPQPPHAHGPPSSHPSPAMASLQNPTLASGPWGPGVPGPPLVDGRERELRDRTHPTLTSERDRDRPDRERDMSLPIREREREWDSPRDQPRRKPQPAGPGVPPPLAGPGTGAPPPVGPGVPPMVGPGIPGSPLDDPHKISTASAPGSSGPSRAHSRSQLAKDDLIEHGKDMERGPRIPERDAPPAGPGRTPDYPPSREYPYRREPGEIPGPLPPGRREREEYTGPTGPAGSARLPPPPPPPPPPTAAADYRSSGEYGREPLPPPDYRREPQDYRRPPDLRDPSHSQRGDYRREPPPAEYRREPPPPAEYRRDAPPPAEYRREPPPADYRDHRREPYPPVDYRREPPPPGEYRRDPHPQEYRTPDYRDARRDLQPPPGSSHSPESYRREPEYRREREPQDFPSSRRNSNEHRRERDGRERMIMEREIMREREREVELRRGDPASGPGIPPGERQPRRSPHQTRDMDRDPYHRRNEDYRREPPPGQSLPHDYRGPPPPEPYRSDYRPPPGDYRREPPPPPSDYPPRREHHQNPQDYRRDDYPRQSHGPQGPPPPPIHSGQEMRGPPPPGPPGEFRGPSGEYRRDVPPGPPQEYRRDVPPPADYRGPPGPLPPPGDYPPRQGPPPTDYRGREPGEVASGPGGRDYPSRREREREPHPRDSGDFSRVPPGDYPLATTRRREEGGEYMGRSGPQPGSVPPGPGVPGRTATPNSEVYVVKHPSERDRDRERERWERDQRERERERGERGHYPPSQQSGVGGPPPPTPANPPHHSHSHSHSKPHPHHHPHHHHVIHSHHGSSGGPPLPPPPPSSSNTGGPPSGPGTSASGNQGGPPAPPPPNQGGAPPQPSQRQMQSQFPTRFVPVNTRPGSRMGSPIPSGPPPGPGGVVGPGSSNSGGARKDVGGSSGSGSGSGNNTNTGKDVKKLSSRSGGPPTGGGGPPVSGPAGRRERDEREMKERETHQAYSQPPPPGQSIPHRGEQGRVLGHGYPPASGVGGGPPPPHGPSYGEDTYMVVDDMEREHREREQHMQMQNQHPPHPHAHPHAHHHPHPHPHPHARPMHLPPTMVQQHPQQHPQHPHPHPHQHHPPMPQVGYYPGPQTPGVEEFWGPPQEQPDREVKSKFKINLGTFVFPNTPFPYHFDVGEWVGINWVNGVNGAAKAAGKTEEGRGVEVDKEMNGEKKEGEKEKEGEVEKKMDIDAEDENVKEKVVEKEKETEAGDVKDKNGEKEKTSEQDREKEKPTEVQVIEKLASQTEEADDMLDVETRATILIPNGYIPREKPLKPALWGGGVIGRPSSPQRPPPTSSSKDDKTESLVRPKKRRIYTDDSDLFLCALHSGWLTWSRSARARDKGQDLRVEVRIIRCAGAGAGSVYAVGAGSHAGKYAPAANSVVATNGTYYRKNGNGKSPVVRKEELVGRFIGGWGEKCFMKDLDTETEDEEVENDEDNDGRGLVSAGWGSGHDGSAIEVLKAEFVNKGTARAAPGLGRRNRTQRLLEYNERRAAVLGLQRLTPPTRLAGRKRRRNAGCWLSVRRLPNASVLDVIPELQEDEMTEDEQVTMPPEPEKKEEALLMAVRTVMFGTGLAGDMRLGYKYEPAVLKDILFPVTSTPTTDRPPARKRRRTTIASADILMEDPEESEPPPPTPNRPVILETIKESYLLSLTHGSEFSSEGRKYDISLILEGEVEEDREDAVVLVVADKNVVKTVETPPPSPPADDDEEEPGELKPPSGSDVAMDTSVAAKSSGEEKTRDNAPSSRPVSPSSSGPRPTTTDSPKAVEDISMGDASASNLSVGKSGPPAKPVKKFKHPVAQVLQRRVGENMFKFTDEGISIADGEEGMPTEWLVQVKSWKWATRKIVRV